MHVALTYNMKDDSSSGDSHDDTYAEWDSRETIAAITDAIGLRHEVTLVQANEDAFEKLRCFKPAFVFNIAEGFFGISREAQIPSMCEMLQIPYLGSDPLTLSLCLDKARTKEVLSYHQIPTASFFVIDTISLLNGQPVIYPQLVKPLHEGSSKGVFNSSLVYTKEELMGEVERIINRYNQPAIVEEFLPGREFTVAILGNPPDIRVLPIVEINHTVLPEGAKPVYSYEAKWVWDRREKPLDIFQCPAQIEPELKQKIEEVCIKTYNILRCRDWSRIDLRLDIRGNPNIIEVNPLPGILPKEEDNSCFPKAARAAGIGYSELIGNVIDISAKRWGIG